MRILYTLNLICLFIKAAKKESLYIENVSGTEYFTISLCLTYKTVFLFYYCSVVYYFIFKYQMIYSH
jgi:hypothetical protein